MQSINADDDEDYGEVIADPVTECATDTVGGADTDSGAPENSLRRVPGNSGAPD